MVSNSTTVPLGTVGNSASAIICPAGKVLLAGGWRDPSGIGTASESDAFPGAPFGPTWTVVLAVNPLLSGQYEVFALCAKAN